MADTGCGSSTKISSSWPLSAACSLPDRESQTRRVLSDTAVMTWASSVLHATIVTLFSLAPFLEAEAAAEVAAASAAAALASFCCRSCAWRLLDVPCCC